MAKIKRNQFFRSLQNAPRFISTLESGMIFGRCASSQHIALTKSKLAWSPRTTCCEPNPLSWLAIVKTKTKQANPTNAQAKIASLQRLSLKWALKNKVVAISIRIDKMKAMIGFSLPYSREYLGFAFQVNRFITIRKLLEIRIVFL